MNVSPPTIHSWLMGDKCVYHLLKLFSVQQTHRKDKMDKDDFMVSGLLPGKTPIILQQAT